MSAETDLRGDKDALAHFTLGKAYLSKGKWHCECKKPARCRTTKRSGPNLGRKFWVCENSKEECGFFLWVDYEAAAKELLKAQVLRSLQPPQTPKKDARSNEAGPSTSEAQQSVPQTRETPFTKAKRKAASRDILMPDDDGEQVVAGEGWSAAIAIDDDPFAYPALPAENERKAAKTSIGATPSQRFAERLKNASESLPTPQTGDAKHESSIKASEALLIRARNTSPTPTRGDNTAATLVPKGETDLTTTVLDLIRADNLKVKLSTEMQIRHEIGLALDLGETKVRRHEGTILELHRRIDELETMILHLT